MSESSTLPINQDGKEIPFTVRLDLSSPICPIDCEPPFTITTTYECITSQPVWALIARYTWRGQNLAYRHSSWGPSKRYRLPHRRPGYDEPSQEEEAEELEDSDLVRFEPGQMFSIEYTFTTEEHWTGTDTRKLESGEEYTMMSMTKRCRWMYEADMPAGITMKQRRDLLAERDGVEWRPDCTASFVAMDSINPA